MFEVGGDAGIDESDVAGVVDGGLGGVDADDGPGVVAASPCVVEGLIVIDGPVELSVVVVEVDEVDVVVEQRCVDPVGGADVDDVVMVGCEARGDAGDETGECCRDLVVVLGERSEEVGRVGMQVDGGEVVLGCTTVNGGVEVEIYQVVAVSAGDERISKRDAFPAAGDGHDVHVQVGCDDNKGKDDVAAELVERGGFVQ